MDRLCHLACVLLLVGGLAACEADPTRPVPLPGAPWSDIVIPPIPILVAPQLSAGGMLTCGLKADGSLLCWQVSSQTPLGASFDPPAGVFTRVSAGWGHACALSVDGSIQCWGYDEDSGWTIAPEGNSFVDVSAGAFHTCGLQESGSLECWGNPPAGLDGRYTQVSTSGFHTCALTVAQSIECVGFSPDAVIDPAESPPQGSFAEVQVGDIFGCALAKETFLPLCWGSNHVGLLDPPAVPLSSLSAGTSHACGLSQRGQVLCWGSNGNGQSAAPAGTFIQVSAGQVHTCGLASDGSILCWGQINGPGPRGNLRLPQIVAFESAPPFKALPGATYSPSVSGGGSGNPVVVTSNSPWVCTVAGGLVTLVDFGTCFLEADQDGNVYFQRASKATQSFAVAYPFEGFLAPVLNPPAFNKVQAGQTVPLKFSLGGDYGTDILLDGRISSTPIGCSGEVIVFPPIEPARGTLSLHGDKYAFNWVTHAGWSGSCRKLTLALKDFTTHEAYFDFR